MREIRFRAWHKTKKKMDEVTSLCTWRRLVYVSKEALSWLFSDIELMQFTGLEDKNGKEIYEGDILSLRGRRLEVRWEGISFKFFDLDKQQWHLFRVADLSRIEVVGNIYEQ